MSSDSLLLAYCTFPSNKNAEEICIRLVNEGVIACANIFPGHTAIYRWQGQLTKERECAALLKTRASKQVMLEERIRAIHPYQVPCLVFLTADGAARDFERWVLNQSL